MSKRTEQISLALQEVVASFVLHNANADPLITITRIDISPELKNATVYFTTIPTEKEEDALHFLQRSGTELRTYVKQHMRLKYLPHFSFSIDYGERHRQDMDELVTKIHTKDT